MECSITVMVGPIGGFFDADCRAVRERVCLPPDAPANLGQIWQGPLNHGFTQEPYLYCNSAPHQLTGIYPIGTTCATKGSATAVYSAGYDAWGNETSRTYNSVTSTLSYDTLNRMTEYSAGANSQEFYLYDGSGNRVLKRTISGGTTKLTTYAFGLQELSYTGSGAYSSQTDYYSIAGHLIGSTNGTLTTYDLTDAEGNVLASLSASAVLGEQIYGPYGNQRYTQGTMGTDKGYTGQFQDAVSGFDYYNARYYDPVMGQFLSADHVQGNAQGMDPYAYAGNNPETWTDPTGNSFGPRDPDNPFHGGNESSIHEVVSSTWQDAFHKIDEGLGNAKAQKRSANNAAIAYWLGKAVESHRHTQPGWNIGTDSHGKVHGGRGSGTNGAAGAVYYTDANGNVLGNDFLKNGAGNYISYSGTKEGHAEKALLAQALKDADTFFAKMKKLGAVSVNFVIFTQLDPCGPCQAYIAVFMASIQQKLQDYVTKYDPYSFFGRDDDEVTYSASLSVWSSNNQDAYHNKSYDSWNPATEQANNLNADVVDQGIHQNGPTLTVTATD